MALKHTGMSQVAPVQKYSKGQVNGGGIAAYDRRSASEAYIEVTYRDSVHLQRVLTLYVYHQGRLLDRSCLHSHKRATGQGESLSNNGGIGIPRRISDEDTEYNRHGTV